MPRLDLKPPVKVAFASGTGELNPLLVDRLAEIYPELPLFVVSEFPPHRGEWIPYHPFRSWRDNLDACRAALAGKRIRLAAVLLVPNVPYRRMRLMALLLSPRGFLAYNENLDSFMLRPRSLPAIFRHMLWRISNFFRWQLRPENPWRRNPAAELKRHFARGKRNSDVGGVAFFPGCPSSGLPVVLIATPYLPFPLAHGGAVRMFNLMIQASGAFDQVLISFCDSLAPPPQELLQLCSEVVLVERRGTHYRRSSPRPDMVEEMDTSAFHGALKQTLRKWRPAIAQLEFTPMAQYVRDCAGVKTILVEHDITFDLQEQLARANPSWEAAQQLRKWQMFERGIWPKFDRVIAMSAKDHATIGAPNARTLPNGVDLARYLPQDGREESRRLLFIGSFMHLPNLLALEFFLDRVWPCLDDLEPTLHVIAGARPDYYLDFYRKKIDAPRVELEGFVGDVRAAYNRAQIVIAPLVASAGTNIKILEAMAMRKAIVTTPAGINGLDVAEGVESASDAAAFAASLRRLLLDADRRNSLAAKARAIVERDYDWRSIGAQQQAIYEELLSESRPDRAAR